MKAKIDKFGRIVIPQKLRERMRLDAGVEVEVVEEKGRVWIEAVHPEPILTREEGGLLVLHAELPGGVDPIRLIREERMGVDARPLVKVLFDTTVLVAALWAEHPLHREASAWILKVRRGEVAGCVAQHSLLETYASLTGMPSRPKLPPAVVKQAILEAISGVEIVEAGARQYQSILDRADTSSLSGGIVYDLLIWLSAEEAGADLLLTANAKDFGRFEAATGPRVQGLS